jgi:hypothetical protein
MNNYTSSTATSYTITWYDDPPKISDFERAMNNKINKIMRVMGCCRETATKLWWCEYEERTMDAEAILCV